MGGLFEDVKKLYKRIDPTFMAITEFTLYANVPMYLKIEIAENTESPLVLVMRASGGKKYENVEVFGSFTQLKPSSEKMDPTTIYLQNPRRIAIKELHASKRFKQTRTFYISVCNPFRRLEMKIKSMAKVPETRKIQVNKKPKGEPGDEEQTLRFDEKQVLTRNTQR